MTRLGKSLATVLIAAICATAHGGHQHGRCVRRVAGDGHLIRRRADGARLSERQFSDSGRLSRWGHAQHDRKCTGGVRLDDIQGLPAAQQRELVRAKWCEVWLDPYGTGEFRNGWVFGRYIRPA